MTAEKKIDVAIVPGAFKPPHKGHLEMVEKYAKQAKEVIVYISPTGRTDPDGLETTVEIAEKLWEWYLIAAALDNVHVIRVAASPVGATYDYLAEAETGQNIVLGVSGKGDDKKRYKDASKYVKQGVQVMIDCWVEATVDEDGTPLSGTRMRYAIGTKDEKELLRHLPDGMKASVSRVLGLWGME